MKFAQFNDQHELCARYDSEIHGDNIPADAVEVSEELFWQTINETDGIWKRDPQTGEITKHPLPGPTQEQLAESVRAKRDALLAACDWVAIRANELGEPVPQDWADYRQALRDVPEQAGFPENVEWPTEPESA